MTIVPDLTYALTLYQPYASLLFAKMPHGGYYKETETRSWQPKQPEKIGWIAIHAGLEVRDLTDMRNARAKWLLAGKPQTNATLRTQAFDLAWNYMPAVFPLGKIIGVAKLERCDYMDEAYIAAKQATMFDFLFGHYAVGRFGWALGERHLLDHPIPAKGNRRLWHLSEEQKTALGGQLDDRFI